jgi:hypothetical protein
MRYEDLTAIIDSVYADRVKRGILLQLRVLPAAVEIVGTDGQLDIPVRLPKNRAARRVIARRLARLAGYGVPTGFPVEEEA